MKTVTLLLIAIALAMDSFAVSITAGLSLNRFKIRTIGRISIIFALCQGLMPVIGWLLGQTVVEYISAIDHWIVFGLLSFIGGKMIYESLEYQQSAPYINIYSNRTISGLGLITSIDALAVGISFSLLKVEIFFSALVIGLVTLGFSFLGLTIGWRLGSVCRNKIELVGGTILIGIGLKVLISHLMGV
jgi:putative Mn2+ efflux pump MntP